MAALAQPAALQTRWPQPLLGGRRLLAAPQTKVAVRPLNAASGKSAAVPVTRASAIMDYVSDMSRAAPKGLFPPEPEKYEGPKLKVAIVGAGLAGMSTAAELLDQGHEVDIYEARPFIGGKVASFQDKDGNHIEMGLHVFFGCYNNLFRLMNKSGAVNNLLRKEHTHVFINKGGVTGELDFRFITGAPFHGLKAFFTTNQLSPVDKAFNALALATSPVVRALVDPEGAFQDIRDLDKVSFSEWFTSHGGTRESIKRMWDPVAYALGFIDCDNISARCMLTIFAFFATKTEASVLRMLCGSPDRFLAGPIAKYITDRGGRFHVRQPCQEVLYSTAADGSTVVTGLRMKQAGGKEQIVTADAYVAALDVPGAKRLVPGEWRERWAQFADIYQLEGVPVITVQLRYDGWVTEMNDIELSRQLARAAGLDNLLYSPDADFSCFADLALTSPDDYYKEGQGSLMQVVITPADPYMPLTNEAIVAKMNDQVMDLFPSARGLNLLWHSVVKINQSLYREAPGLDQFRPDQQTPVPNFFLAGSYTKQDYIDSMEGATLSGRRAAARICEAGEAISRLSAAQRQAAPATAA
ncbi:hypothetical protein CLOM_g6497 [Closterium sp. NIES-68]|nr:hypothetical protein CLOM_g6497 [Closterium sp. NIES-68]GJP80514.1 hypothetical protein CLOP_g10721 [Closterium sp. NIES-67]